MALVKCPDCGRDISDLAPACVNCGRPMAGPAAPMDYCEVVLRLRRDFIGGGQGFAFGSAHWILEAQVATPAGIDVVASCEYSSNNDLAEYQGEMRGFQQARQRITNELLRDGWEQLGSVGFGALLPPSFQRRAGVEKEHQSAERERLLQLSEGTGLGGVVVSRLRQRVNAAGWVFNVFVDGVKVAKIATSDIVRLDLTSGSHIIKFSYRLNASDMFEVSAEPGTYRDLTCGFAPGQRGLKFTLRGADGTQLSKGDIGQPFLP